MGRVLGCVLGVLILVARVTGQADDAAEPQPIVPPVDAPTLRVAAELLAGPQPAREVTWTGRVVGPDHAPLAGVDVWLHPDGPTLRALGYEPQLVPAWSGMRITPPQMLHSILLRDCAHTVTGADGRFAVTQRLAAGGEPAGLLGLNAVPWAPLVVFGRDGDALRVSSTHRWDQPGPAVELGDMLLVPEAAVAGRVVDARGEPVSGTVVRVLDQNIAPVGAESGVGAQTALLAERHTTRTAADGTFRLAGLWPGRVDLGFEHPRHPLRELEAAVAPAGRTGELPDIALDDGIALSGVVLDAAGRPVAGARVAATTRRIGMYGLGCMVSGFESGDDTLPTELLAAYGDARVSRTDATGAFEIGGLRASSTLLFVEADGHAPCVVRELVPPVAGVEVRLPALADLLVRVVDAADGQPLASSRLAAVRCQQAHASRYSASSETDLALVAQAVPEAPGEFRVRGAGPVRTHLVAVAPGFAPASVDVQGVPPGAHETVEVRLRTAAALAGRVTDVEGRAVPDAVVSLYPGENAWLPMVAEVHSDADGAFAFAALGGGRFDLAVTAPGHGGVLVRGLDVGADLAPLALNLPPAARLEFTLGEGDGKAIDRTAYLTRSDLSREDATRAGFLIRHTHSADAAGTFAWEDLPAGRYKIRVRDMPDREVELRAGETTRLELDGPGGCRVEGRVTRDGQPVPGAQVGLVTPGGAEDSNVSCWAETDDDGRYAAWIPAAKSCRVTVHAPTEPAADGPEPSALVASSAVVDVVGKSALSVDVALPTGSLAGQLVRAETGEPLADATVQIVGSEWGEGAALTDVQGRFLFVDVPDGEYAIERAGHGPVVAARSPAVQVRDGQAVPGIRIAVPRGARLSCSVRRPNGTPAPDGSSLTVYLVGSRDGATWGHTVAGHCLVDELRPGHYRIEYTPAGQLGGSHEEASAREIDLAENGEASVEFVIDA